MEISPFINDIKDLLEKFYTISGFPLTVTDYSINENISFGRPEHDDPKIIANIIYNYNVVGLLELYYAGAPVKERCKSSLSFLLDDIRLKLENKYRVLSLDIDSKVTAKTLEYFYKIFRSLTSVIEVKTVCNDILEMIIELISVNRASIMLFNDKEKVLKIFASQGISKDIIEKVTIKPGEGIAGKVYNSGKPKLVTTEDFSKKTDKRIDAKFATNSFLSIPLKFIDDTGNEEIIGVINTTDKIGGNDFLVEDLNLITSVSSVATMAIVISRLYQDLHSMYDELKRKSDIILNNQESLIRAERLSSLGVLSASVAHEINTPLSVISGAAQLIMMKNSDPFLKKYAKNILAQIDRVSNITQKLLGFARDETSEISTEHINRVIDDTLVFTCHYLSRFKRIKISTDLTEGLPPIRIDRKLIQQVFVNLINNAADAMENGGDLNISTQQAHCKIDKNGQLNPDSTGEITCVLAKFSDSGCGIKEENLGRIFESFFTTKAPGFGTGLGLHISKNIIEKHKGMISVESQENIGTTFSIYIPAVVENKTEIILP